MKKLDPEFRNSLEAAFHHSIAHLENLDSDSVGATLDYRALKDRLRKTLTDDGVPAIQVINELAADTKGGLLGSPGGRFFGWVIGGSVPAALAADWLVSAWDQNAALYACSPAAAVAEEIAGEWLKDILALPTKASFALVTGCQMAHVTCLAAARNSLLARRDYDVENNGLYGAPRIRILSSTERHASFARAVRLVGFGLAQVEDLQVDDEGRLLPRALEQALEKDPTAPTIVLLQAGEINTGAFDQFDGLIPIAHRFGAWVHVDGAFGLWAAASPAHRHFTTGMAEADSWATDGHKWLNVPFDSGFAFVANPQAHRASLAQRASYLIHADEARDQMNWNPEWSRRARGFPTYAALRQLGRNGVANLVDRCCRHARAIVLGIGALPNAEVVWEPTINQGLVRFLDPRAGATEADHDRRTDETIAAIVASGEAFFGGTTWRGKRCMRVSVCNWQTSDKDVSRVVAAVEKILTQ
jgi:glutamate/tyrosine decarboxylase-like PLP-dependent enzyme